MAKFRATVWVLPAAVSAVEGFAGVTRFVVEREAESEVFFKADILDQFVTPRDVDNEVWFGPVTRK